MFTKNFNSIDLNRVKIQIEFETLESKTLEFKEQSLVDSNGQKKEFLYDISVFANTIGGISVGFIESTESKAIRQKMQI